MTIAFCIVMVAQSAYLALHPQYPWFAPTLSAPIVAVFPVVFGDRPKDHGRLLSWVGMAGLLMVVGNVTYWVTRIIR